MFSPDFGGRSKIQCRLQYGAAKTPLRRIRQSASATFLSLNRDEHSIQSLFREINKRRDVNESEKERFDPAAGRQIGFPGIQEIASSQNQYTMARQEEAMVERRTACATAFRNLGPFGACVFTSFHDYLDVHKTSIKLVADKTH